jgi:hypothetical protein
LALNEILKIEMVKVYDNASGIAANSLGCDPENLLLSDENS